MGVICSGHPNSGTYMLVKCVELMGYKKIQGHIVNGTIVFNQWDRPLKSKERIWDEPYKTIKKYDLSWLDTNLLPHQCIHAHSPEYIEGHKNVFIMRDPRHVLLSRLRRRILEKHPTLIKWDISPNYSRQVNFFHYMKKHGEPVVKKIQKYFSINRGFRVYYKAFKHPVSLRNLADYLEVDKIPTEKELQGHTLTWSGHPSEYKKWWSRDTEILFESIGGNDLVRRMGYIPFRNQK